LSIEHWALSKNKGHPGEQMKDFRQLKVWQKAHQVTLDLYPVTQKFPVEERYGLTSQIRRCAASIGANIAEGCGKAGEIEFQRFLQISSGSASELAYHLILARDLSYLSEADFKNFSDRTEEVQKMLASLLSKITNHRHKAAGA
jgi:four helix bundle protein